MTLTEIDFQIFCLYGSSSQKGSRPLAYIPIYTYIYATVTRLYDFFLLNHSSNNVATFSNP